MCPRLNSLTYPRCSISARRNKTARSCTSAAAINECYQSPRSAILHSQRSNPHSDRPATDRTYSSAAPPPYLPRFPPLEVFGSPARTPAYLGSHVVHGPASENLHRRRPEQVQQDAPEKANPLRRLGSAPSSARGAIFALRSNRVFVVLVCSRGLPRARNRALPAPPGRNS